MPDPDLLLAQVARLARQDEAFGVASERRIAGTASPEDEALSADLPESFAERISRVQEAAVVEALERRLARRGGGVRRLRRFAGSAIAACAIAAAALLWLRPKSSSDEPLAPYEVRVEGSVRSERSSTRAPALLQLRPESTLTFELRPQRDVQGHVHARMFIRAAGSADSSLPELDTVAQQSAAGALRVEVRVPNTLPAAGELVLYVGRGEAAPTLSQSFRLPFERTP